jgi:protein dithiol oxidoreductase (disulfide-forming)
MRKRWLPLLAALIVPFLLAVPAGAVDEGIDYKRIEPPQPTTAPGKVEVVELFWYGCPGCYAFKPFLNRWLDGLPEQVEFVRVPATLNPNWVVHARAHYAAEQLGVLEQIHAPLFDAIHLDRRRLDNEAALAEFFAEHGVAENAFRDAFRSFAVETKVRRAAALTQRYGITGVPSIVIDGKYRTDGSMAGGFENVLRVLDHLIKQESARLAADGG